MGIRLILVEAHMEKQHRTIRIPFQHFIFLHSRPYRELILILGIILGEHGTPNNREHSSQTILVRVMTLFDEVWHYYFSQSNSSLCSSSDLLPDSTTLSWDALCRFSIISCRVCPTTKRYLKVWSHGFSWAEVVICFFRFVLPRSNVMWEFIRRRAPHPGIHGPKKLVRADPVDPCSHPRNVIRDSLSLMRS